MKEKPAKGANKKQEKDVLGPKGAKNFKGGERDKRGVWD